LLRCGKIANLREQVRFELLPKQEGERAVHYVADFVYEEPSTNTGVSQYWVQVVEDCKGYRTPEYRLKRKLLLFRFGIRIRET
jgi:hypothetical protein